MNENPVSGLLSHREKLLSFIRRKVSDPDWAEDILQDGLLKALRAAHDLKDEEKLIPWFYRILNHAIIDHYRRRQTESKYFNPDLEQEDFPVEPEDSALLCECFRELIPTLKTEYAIVIEEMELLNAGSEQMAKKLGISSNNLKVRRHRARQALRHRLEETCRTCASHGCLDCSCQ